MRMSDWSSDVCSSDLPRPRELACQQHRCAFKLWLGRAQPDVVTGAKRDTVQHQTFGVQRITLDVRVAGRRRGGEIDHRAFMAAARSFGDVECDFRSHRRSEEHTSELQSLMRTSYAVFFFNKKKTTTCRHKVSSK